MFQNHDDCPISIKFKDAYAAEQCIAKMNGRVFDGNTLECDYWDGVTNYTKKEEDGDVSVLIMCFYLLTDPPPVFHR